MAVLKTPHHPDALLQAAEQFGTPAYVYFENVIRERCRALRRNLDGVPIRLLYAMKANSNPALLQVIQDEGCGVDVVSPGEMALALRLGIPVDQVLYSANNMTDEEMAEAYEAGVRMNIGELSRLERYGRAFPGADVCIRLNPLRGAGHHEHVITAGEQSKFGISVERTPEILEIVHRHGLRVVGLHQHIGSGILDAEQFSAAIHVLLRAAGSFPDVRFLNFGGGLGIPYRPGEAPIDFENFQEVIVAPLQAFLESHPTPVEFWFEPGRFLVAESGVLLTRVNTLKKKPTRTFAGTDSGFNQLIRPVLYDAYHAIYNLSNPAGPLLLYDITGNVCETGDLFARERPVQEIREGDVLAILDTGAYGMAMASEYNLRPLPPEVLIRADGTFRLIRRRLSCEELVERLLADAVCEAPEAAVDAPKTAGAR